MLSSPSPLTGRTLSWIAFFAVILGAWGLLFALAAHHAAGLPAGVLGPGMSLLSPVLSQGFGDGDVLGVLEAICFAGPAIGDAPPASVLAMWALMALAMMAPTATPLLKTYSDLSEGNPQRIPGAGFWALLAGFCLVWLGFALAATLMQAVLARAGLLSPGGLIESPWLAAAILAAAGLYQFSSLKAACLARCRSPLAFFLSNWRDGAAGALRMGLRSGLDCLGCCWALMLLAFVGGTMNLVWMGLATLLMTAEKLPALGEPISRPLGGILLLTAAAVVWRATAL